MTSLYFRLLFCCSAAFVTGYQHRLPSSSRLYFDALLSTPTADNTDEARRDEVRRAVEEAMRNDAEWFKSTFGDPNNFEGVQQKEQQSSSSSLENQDMNDGDAIATSSEDLSCLDYEAFEILGYSKDEVAMLKDNIRKVILARNTIRPRRGIPSEWCDIGHSELEANGPSVGDSNMSDGSNSQLPKPSYYVEREIDPRDIEGAIGAKPSGFYVDKREGGDMKDTYDSDRRERMRKFEDSREVRMRQGDRDKSRGVQGIDGLRTGTNAIRSDTGEAFSWKGTPPTVVELQKRIDSYEDDVMANDDFLSQPPTFFPGREEFKDLLIEESKARIQVTGDWMKPLVQAEAKWRYNLYKSFLSFVGNDLGEGFDVESLTSGQDGQSSENRKQKIRRQEDNAKMYEDWIEERIASKDGWTEITRDDQYGDDYQSISGRIDKDSWFSDSDADVLDNSDNIEFAWSDKFIDESDMREDQGIRQVDDESRRIPGQTISRNRGRQSASTISNRRTPLQRSYDLESDEY